MTTEDTPLSAPDDTGAGADRRAVRILARVVAQNAQVLEAARIEMLQNGPHAAMQWILSSQPDQWDGLEGTAWDGSESAQEWFDRTEEAYRGS